MMRVVNIVRHGHQGPLHSQKVNTMAAGNLAVQVDRTLEATATTDLLLFVIFATNGIKIIKMNSLDFRLWNSRTLRVWMHQSHGLYLYAKDTCVHMKSLKLDSPLFQAKRFQLPALSQGWEMITYKQVLMFPRINSAQQMSKIWDFLLNFNLMTSSWRWNRCKCCCGYLRQKLNISMA